MNINKAKLAELFKHHPPSSDRGQKHEVINAATFQFILTISEVIDNPAELTVIIRKMQEIRNSANTALTYDEMGLSIRNIFED